MPVQSPKACRCGTVLQSKKDRESCCTQDKDALTGVLTTGLCRSYNAIGVHADEELFMTQASGRKEFEAKLEEMRRAWEEDVQLQLYCSIKSSCSRSVACKKSCASTLN